MLQDFDELCRKRTSLASWWSLGATDVGYGDGKHVLRVDVQKPTMVAFCGQAYAGASNYHDAPDFFASVILRHMNAEIKRITREAYEAEMARLTAEIAKHRDAVLAQLESAPTPNPQETNQ